jgi:hypothetical protein
MTQVEPQRRSRVEPRRGDVVRVRSREEILATLDHDGSLDALPFMPEMLKFAGQELTLWARADKTCDTLQWTGNRRMEHTVHLDGARCDGSAHGGCEAKCMLFWREEWLEWPDTPGEPIRTPEPPASGPATMAEVEAGTTPTGEPTDAAGPYRCQATEHFKASEPIPRHNYMQYLHDIRIRNVTTWTVLRGLLFFVFTKYQRISKRYLPEWLRIQGGRDFPFVVPSGTGERIPSIELQPGDLVEVRSKEEILATLGPDQRNRNMWFDEEMVPYCGRRARVLSKVTRILDENTGKMIKLGDCYVLEDVVCLGLYHRFCQRAITPYWRSGWLKKVADPTLGPSRPLPGARVEPRR